MKVLSLTTTTTVPKPNYTELILRLAWTDFKLRYQGSVLGFLWTLLKPLLQFAVLYTVFSVFMRLAIPNYQLYLLLGILIWNYFSEGTNTGLFALANKANIIKKVYFPRIIVIVAASLHTLLTLLINLLIFFAFFFFFGHQLQWTAILFILLLILLYGLVLGLSLLLSVFYLKFRDINQIWEVFLMAGFYLSPIIYPLEFIPEEYRLILFLNPITGIIQYARLLLLEGQLPSLMGTLYVSGFTLTTLLLGFWLFSRNAYRAAEEL